VDAILGDLNHTAGSREDRWIRAAAVPGSSIAHDAVRASADAIESIVHFRNARARERSNDLGGAAYHYTEALRHRPDFPAANRRMGDGRVNGIAPPPIPPPPGNPRPEPLKP